MHWIFSDFISTRGVNEIHEWLNSKEVRKEAKAKINARLIALQGFPVFPEQYFSSYEGWDGLYEIRVVFQAFNIDRSDSTAQISVNLLYWSGASKKGKYQNRH